MGQSHQTFGSAVPFFVYDWHLIDLSTAHFDPITDLHDDDYVSPDEMAEQRAIALYEKNGFLARPNADGAFYAVSLARYNDAIKGADTLAKRRIALAALLPKKFNALAGSWIECPLVKIFDNSGDRTGHYETVATEVEVGIIL